MMISTLLLSSLIVAPVAPAPNAESADEQARVASDEYIFEIGDSLEGKNIGPTGTHVRSHVNKTYPSMVLIRASFVDRLHEHVKRLIVVLDGGREAALIANVASVLCI